MSEIEANKQTKNDNINEASKTVSKEELVKRNKAVEWTHENIMVKLDKYAFLRSTIIFTLLFFFLGNNLKIYIYLFCAVTYYMMILRFLRWWVKRWLLYLSEFCYFGIITLTIHLLLYPTNKDFYFLTYTYTTGNMALAAVIFNNSALFVSTDHISSAFLHVAPIVTTWAIRWRKMIYGSCYEEYFGFYDFYNELTYSEYIRYFIAIPLIFWILWACIYLLNVKLILKKFFEDGRDNGVYDFMKLGVFKSLKIQPVYKYLLSHFLLYLIGIPFSFLSFHNFYFNTLYFIVIIYFVFAQSNKQVMKTKEKQEKSLS